MGSQPGTDRPGRMKLIIRDTAGDVTEWAAKYVIKRINAFNPGPGKMFVLGLPTGGTPLGMYKKLVQAHKAGKIFFKHIDSDPKNAHGLNGNAEDLVAECQ